MISSLGRFQIEAEIGHGGFGKVFRAFDPKMNRVVAIKELTATEDANALNRFKQEASAAGNLRHENIVTVHEFGEEGNKYFLVMQYLDGEDLEKIIKHKALSLYQKVRVMDQVAAGLHYAHQNGVLHRDVKPANIMVCQDGAVKIMDFGIARLTRDTNIGLTEEGFLIGTAVYMAPELFAGTKVDALCDIWSYGVVFYELLAGRNPFQNGDLEPLPPGVCPPELQTVISKLLSRPREFRYQSLEDLRFDLQPILKNLEKAESDRLLVNAQQLLFQGKWGEALGIAREARRMDPQNGTARIIFERAQTELQRQSKQPKIDDLLQRSNGLAEQRKLGEAIGLLIEARKLDSTNEKVLTRLQDLQVLKERLDEAAKLALEAGNDFRGNRLTNAFEHATNSLALDSDNRDAQGLLEKIRVEMQARETERAAEQELRRARGLMAVNELDGAAGVLENAAAKYPGRADIKDLHARVSHLIAERKRRADFSERLGKAKGSVRNEQYAEAVRDLEQLLKSFPNEVDAIDLLAFARQELKAKQRSEEIKKILDSAVERGLEQHFDEAIWILEAGLKRFPDDLPLTRQLRSVLADKQAFDRERSLQDGLLRCDALRQRQQWPEALELIGKLGAEHQNSRELTQLEARIIQEKSQAERATALRNALEQAEEYLKAGDPDHASMILESAILGFGAQRELTVLLDKVHEAQRAERERRYIQSELKHAIGFEQSGDITMSLKIIDDALLRSPKSAELLGARERLTRDRERVNRDRMLSTEAAIVEDAINRKEWPAAMAKLEEATKLFPAERRLSRLDEELRRRKQDDLREKLIEGRRLLNGGQVQEAEDFVSAHLLNHRDDPEVMSLGRDIVAEKRRRERVRDEEGQRIAFVAECLRAAQACEQKGDLAGALSSLETGRARYPEDPELASAQRRIKEQITVARRRQLHAGIRQALDLSNWLQSLQLIEQARQDFPNDPALIPLHAEALDKRRAFLESASAAIRSKLGENMIDDARTLFDQNLARHQDQGIVKAVAADIAAAEAQRDAKNKAYEQKRAFLSENLKRATDLEQGGDYPRAIATLQKALKRYPADAELSATLNRLQSAMQQVENDRALAAVTAGIRQDLDRGNWEDALKRVDEARGTFPGSAELKSLEEQARNRRARELQTLVDKARNSLNRGNLADAEKILTKSRVPFAGESAVAELANTIKAEKERQEEEKARELRDREMRGLIDKTDACLKLGNVAEAERLLSKKLAPYAAEPAVVALATAINEEKVRQSLIQAVRSHAAARHFAEAEAAIKQLAASNPSDAELGRLRSELESAREQERKEKLYRAGRAAGDQLLRNRQYPEAIAHFEYLLTQFPGDRLLQQDLAAAIHAQKLHEKPISLPDTSSTVVSNEPHPPPVARKPRGLLYAIAGIASLVVIGLAIWLWPQSKVQVSLEVSPKELSFEVRPGAPLEAQKVTVTGPVNPGPPTVSAGWVTVTRGDSSGNKTEFLVKVSPDALAAGKTYNAELAFSPDERVRVDLNIPPLKPQRTPGIQPGFLRFPDQSGSLQAQTITITGSSDVAEPKRDAPWVTARRASSSAGTTVFLVRVSPDGLAPGRTYNAVLTFPADKKVRVELTVPQSGVQPSFLKFPDPNGSMQETVTVTSSSPIPEPQSTAAWVTAQRASSSAGRAVFLIRVVPDGLAPGTHNANLTFLADKKVPVELIIPQHKPPPPTPEVQPTTLSFEYTRPGPAPSPKSFTVTGLTDVPDPTRTPPWIQLTRSTPGANVFQVQVLPEKVNLDMDKDGYSDDVIFVFPPQEKVRVNLKITDGPEKVLAPIGTIDWSGVLNQGDELITKGKHIIKGNGTLHGDPVRANVSIVRASLPPGIEVVEEPNQGNNFKLHLRNNAGHTVNSLRIQWKK